MKKIEEDLLKIIKDNGYHINITKVERILKKNKLLGTLSFKDAKKIIRNINLSNHGIYLEKNIFKQKKSCSSADISSFLDNTPLIYNDCTVEHYPVIYKNPTVEEDFLVDDVPFFEDDSVINNDTIVNDDSVLDTDTDNDNDTLLFKFLDKTYNQKNSSNNFKILKAVNITICVFFICFYFKYPLLTLLAFVFYYIFLNIESIVENDNHKQMNHYLWEFGKNIGVLFGVYLFLSLFLSLEFFHNKIIDDKVIFSKFDILILIYSSLFVLLNNIRNKVKITYLIAFAIIPFLGLFIPAIQIKDLVPFSKNNILHFFVIPLEVIIPHLWLISLIPLLVILWVKKKLSYDFIILTFFSVLIICFKLDSNRILDDYYNINSIFNNGYCENIKDDQLIIINSKNPNKIVLEKNKINKDFMEGKEQKGQQEFDAILFKNEKERFIYYGCK